MTVTLKPRTAAHVAIYFEKTNNEMIRSVLPQKARTVEEALEDFEQTLLPSSTSFGQTIYSDEQYVGDIWCYCIDPDDTPNAMISYCIFEPECWNQGIATDALKQFLPLIREKFKLNSVGAFTYSDNLPSIRVLEKCGFQTMEEFVEDGKASKYFEINL